MRWPLVLALYGLLASTYPFFAQEQPANILGGFSSFRFGLSSAVIEPDLNPSDAMAAAIVWARTLGKSSGLWQETDAKIFQSLGEVIDSMAQKKIEFVSLATQEYLQIERDLGADAFLTYQQGDRCELEFLVLVKGDSSYTTLGSLAGKRIAFPKGGKHSLAPIWLDVLLAENNLPPKESFFREAKEVSKASQAILPVFFQQMDAALVIKSAFEIAATQNPQIGRQMRVLATSPTLVPMVMCLRRSLSSETKDKVRAAALLLHENPYGLQTLRIFKIDRLMPWESRYLDNVRELMSKYQKLKSSEKGRPSSSPQEGGTLKR